MNRPIRVSLLACVAALWSCQQAPGTASVQPPLVVSFYTHEGALALYRSAKYADAQAMCTQAVSSIEKARGPKSPELAPPLIDLATVYLRQACYADARTVIDRADSVLDRNQPEQALLVGRLAINKGWRLYSLGESKSARAVFDDARQLLEKYVKGDSVDLAEIINNLALTYDDDDPASVADARRMLIQAWQMRRRLTGDNSPESAESVNNLGMFLLDHATTPDEQKNAVKTLERSLEMAVTVYTEDNPEAAQSHANLAIGYLHIDELEKAETQVRIALAVTTKFLGEDHPERAGELLTLGEILKQQTQFDQAELAVTKALAINEKTYGITNSNVIDTLTILQHLYEASGNESKLRAVRSRIEKLSGKEI